MPMHPNASSFIVPLTHDANSNQTALWERIQKQPFIGNEHKYQNIIKILNNARDTISKCKSHRIAPLSRRLWSISLQTNARCTRRSSNWPLACKPTRCPRTHLDRHVFVFYSICTDAETEPTHSHHYLLFAFIDLVSRASSLPWFHLTLSLSLSLSFAVNVVLVVRLTELLSFVYCQGRKTTRKFAR